MLVLWKAYELYDRLVVVCTQTMVWSIQDRLACNRNSIKFSYVIEYKSISFILT